MTETINDVERAKALWTNHYLLELSKYLVTSGVINAESFHSIIDDVTDEQASRHPILGAEFESIRGAYKTEIVLPEG